ncbi:RraA family protein [Roseococcus sp.]|uniref:RraA family protein n=1 Tax=Roseococcus sp. TaxID=2109646 RepID=UPI003BA95168
MTVGFRIRPITTRVDPALVARAAKLPVANIGDVMNRLQALSGTFHSFGGKKRLCGPAFTVKARSGDNLMLHHAVDAALPGDIIVADGNGDLTVGLMGDLMLGHATKRRIGGVIVDGAVRDIPQLAKMDLGVWARGHTPAGPFKDGPGEIGYAVSCGGQVVMPGDLICCDEDGVVVVPMADAERVIADAEKHQAKEIQAEKEIQAGTWPREWVLASLKDKGCEGA